jgi:hypothetical protein
MATTPILEPGSPLDEYMKLVEPTIGTVESKDLGELDAVTIGRYALTIGTKDPIHVDEAAARAAGYAGLVAPQNMLSAIFEWGVGTPEDELNEDGTPSTGEAAVGAPGLGLRAMGAGERMELVNDAIAGMSLVLETGVRSAVPKNTRSGPCVFVTMGFDFLTADGTVLNLNERTVVLRNPEEA